MSSTKSRAPIVCGAIAVSVYCTTAAVTSDPISEMMDIMETLAVPILSPDPGQQAATGGVQFTPTSDTQDTSGVTQELAFSAIRRVDGSAMGEMQTAFLQPGFSADTNHTSIVCLFVRGNSATMVAADRTQDPNSPFGKFTIVGVTDNGQGNPRNPDTIAFLDARRFLGSVPANQLCDAIQAPGGTIKVTKGDIQVRSS